MPPAALLRLDSSARDRGLGGLVCGKELQPCLRAAPGFIPLMLRRTGSESIHFLNGTKISLQPVIQSFERSFGRQFLVAIILKMEDQSADQLYPSASKATADLQIAFP